jgi:hypothetical protein
VVSFLHPRFLQGALLSPNVGDTGGILSHENDRKARSGTGLGEGFGIETNLLPHLPGQSLSI